MKSAATIQMDFQKAEQCAGELEEIAAEMKKLANQELADSFQVLSAAWKGEAASLYLQKGEQLKARIHDSSRKLEKTAAAMRNMAKRIYHAEMQAYELAQERVYGNH